jgi:hypothetical protein
MFREWLFDWYGYTIDRLWFFSIRNKTEWGDITLS